MAPENLFAGAYLDRRAEARLRDDWLAEARADADTLYLIMRGGATLTLAPRDDAGARIALLAGEDNRVATADSGEFVLLGWAGGRRCVLVTLEGEIPLKGPQEQLAELRPLANELPAAEAGLVAYARALHLWHANHRFCSRCGAPTRAARAGHIRLCEACGHPGFPRLDPAIIVLVHDGDRALLGRQPSWAPNRYSTIAGFVEPGESLEDAVRREVAEETGITVGAASYHSSQPWPFPASLMVGFLAQGQYAPPQLRDGELEDARWLTRAEIAAGVVQLPPPDAIARRLIEQWLGAT